MDITEENQYKDIKAEFSNYWLRVLLPALAKKEQMREKYVSRFWLLVLLALFVFPMICIGFYILGRSTGKAFDPSPLYMIFAILVFLIQTPYRTYKKLIKHDIMPLFVGFFEGFTYQHGQGLTSHEIEDSHIFPSFDTATADDCFFGTYQGVKLRVCEEILKVFGHKKREKVVFKGIAVEFEISKKFKGQTVVLKDAGIFNRLKKVEWLEKIKLEDPVFEELFEVYGSDQIEARYLLSPLFMERMIKLKDLYCGQSVQMSFLDNKLIIAIGTKMDMFEPFSFFKTNINKQKIDRVFEQFLTIFEIVCLLKLNQQNIER